MAAGFETQREEWERQYAEAQARFEAHQKQVVEAQEADAEAVPSGCRGRRGRRRRTPRAEAPAETEAPASGTLASDEALAALREKLAGAD